jgi:2'-5' RNA ligase
MSDTSRLFFALWPDNNTRHNLARFSQSILTNDCKRVPPNNLHVTLVFIGNVNKAGELAIKQQVANISSQPFVVVFDQLSYWNKPKVISLTSQHPADPLMILSESLNRAVTGCGIETDSKPYNPHVTLARHILAFVDRECEPLVWRAESFCLVESSSSLDGVCYTVKEQWSFVKKD